jgi:NTE family protein
LTPFRSPEVLVLGGGGILGEAWMNAVLAGIEDASGFDARECEGYIGTSAGSIVAAALAGGKSPGDRLGSLPEPPAQEDPDEPTDEPSLAARAVRSGVATAAAPVAALALPTIAPGGALVRRLALSRVPPGKRSLGGLGAQIDSLGAHFDGRLSVSAVDLESGRRVTFGQPDAPDATVGQAVEASCAIPGYFRPVAIGGRSYVDGGAWSPTNMDAASVSRGTQVLCLNPTGSMAHSFTSAMGAIGLASRSLARLEALVLERRGARVEIVAPDEGSLEAIGPNLMDPRPRKAVIAAGLTQGRRLGRRNS